MKTAPNAPNENTGYEEAIHYGQDTGSLHLHIEAS